MKKKKDILQDQIQISIIIPVYNVKKYISKCLYNICNQNNVANIEIILIDDGSTDGSFKICKRYAQTYPWIKLIHQSNLGQSVARNNGIRLAQGKWINFIDSDDVVVDNYISILKSIINNLDNSTTDIVMFKYKNFEEDNEIVNDIKKDFSINKIHNINKKEAMYCLTVPEGWGNYLWNKVYRRDILKKALLPEGKKYEDIATLYKYFNIARQISVYDDVLYFYRQRMNSTVHMQNRKTDLDEIEARKEQLNFFELHGYMEAYNEAAHFYLISCMGKLSLFFSDSTVYSSLLKFIRSYNVSIKKDGVKTWIKVKLIQLSPRVFVFLFKLKRCFKRCL